MAAAVTSAANAPTRLTSAAISPGRQREDRVTVVHGMGGANRPRQTIVRHLRDFVRLGFAEPRVRRHDADDGVLHRRGRGIRRKAFRTPTKPPSGRRNPPMICPSSSTTSPTALTAHNAATIKPSPRSTLAEPTPPLVASSLPIIAPIRQPVPAPTLPCSTSLVARVRAGGIAHRGIWAHVAATNRQVEDNRRWDNRHQMPRSRAVADAVLFQIAHSAVGRRQPVSAAAGEHHSIDDFDAAQRIEQRDLAGAGSAAAHIHAADGIRRAENRGAAGDRLEIGRMTDANTGHSGQGIIRRRRLGESSSS